MYNPQTGTLILGDEIYGKTICSSHSQEFHASRAEGCFDDYLRGWIGTSKSYPHGIIHFAPAVIMEQFDRGFDALQMFAGLEGVNGDTIVRGFCTLPEQRMGDLLHSSLWDTGSDKISYDKVSCLWQHRRWRARYPFVNYRNSVGGFLLYLSLFLCSYTWAKPSSLYINYMYNLYGLLSAVTVRFFRCKGRLPRLIRRLEVYFLQILPSTKSNWQEKPSYEAVPAAGYSIYKIPERFRQRKEPIRGKK